MKQLFCLFTLTLFFSLFASPVRSALSAYSQKDLHSNLPYDAEVEYIFATGSQYIDIPTKGTVGAYYEISGMIFMPTFDRGMVFDTDANRQFWSQGYSISNGIITMASIVGEISNMGGWTIEMGKLAYFEVSTLGRTYQGKFNPLTRQLTSGFTIIRIFSKLSYTQDRPNGRFGISKLEIKSGEVLEHSFIAVRFTNEIGISEGAMYDRISGELFRNQGTGSFIIGPDKD